MKKLTTEINGSWILNMDEFNGVFGPALGLAWNDVILHANQSTAVFEGHGWPKHVQVLSKSSIEISHTEIKRNRYPRKQNFLLTSTRT